MRIKYTKGHISIIIGYGNNTHNPDEIKNPGINCILYIQYEGILYKCKNIPPVMSLIVDNYSEEIFLNKLLNIIV